MAVDVAELGVVDLLGKFAEIVEEELYVVLEVLALRAALPAEDAAGVVEDAVLLVGDDAAVAVALDLVVVTLDEVVIHPKSKIK